jgi:glycerol uptake facilitator-like aquaporin
MAADGGKQAVAERQQNSGATMRELVAETAGTAFLVAAIVGSGIAGLALAEGNTAVALLANALTTSAILVVLIVVFAPVSGAHFNPAVSFAFWLTGGVGRTKALQYSGVQIVGGILGTILAHLMFGLEPVQIGTLARNEAGHWLGEFVATLALVFTIIGCLRQRPEYVPWAVGLVIGAGIWYTSSTSFANPAVTIARIFTDTFAAIQPLHAIPFIVAQLAGAGAAVWAARWLFAKTDEKG